MVKMLSLHMRLLFLHGLVALAAAGQAGPDEKIEPHRQRRPRLQIINCSRQIIDVFWLKPGGERVGNGTVAPGDSPSSRRRG